MIYSWIWRKLPGGRVLKVLQVAALFCFVVTLLFLVVFPAIDVIFIEPPVVGQ
jgi:hypothetical protein